MLIAFFAPADNERGPRYMEKALAAVHQAGRDARSAVSLLIAERDGRVGIALRCDETILAVVEGAVLANYPNCVIAKAEEQDERHAAGTRWAELSLVPELFPILRHAQFEDSLNSNFADPINGLLRAIKPDEQVQCRIEISIKPAAARRCRAAEKAVQRLDRGFFRKHPRLAEYYARRITQWRGGILPRLLGLLAARSAQPSRSSLETSASRQHDREDDLQAAAEKVGGHLFEANIRLIVHASAGAEDAVMDRMRQMAGAFGAFTKSRLATFHPRLEDTLRNAVFATVEQGGTMMSLMRLLGERPYRDQVVGRIRDDVVRSFWLHEFAAWSDNYRTEAVAAIQNKIRPFLTNTNIRAIVSQSGKSLDLRQVMDDGKVLIVNLSKGRLGEDNAMLLGAFLVTSIQQAAMTRADIPEEARRGFFLYVDEFQNFTTGSFASVLSEARKYRLSLTVAHQYLTQLNDETANAVWGNVGSIIAFQVGSDDAEHLARQLSKYPGQIKPQDFTSLPKYTAYARLLIDGMPTDPFSLQTLPPPAAEEDRSEVVRQRSHRLYARKSGN